MHSVVSVKLRIQLWLPGRVLVILLKFVFLFLLHFLFYCWILPFSFIFTLFFYLDNYHLIIMLKLLFFHIWKASLDPCYLSFPTHLPNPSAAVVETFMDLYSPPQHFHIPRISLIFLSSPTHGGFIALPALRTAYLTVRAKWVLTEWISTTIILKNREKGKIK